MTDRTAITGKRTNRGIEAMFVGYSKDHAMGVYRWYCFSTRSIRESRDCRFLNMHYTQWKNRDQMKSIKWADEVFDEIETVKIVDQTLPPAEVNKNPDSNSEGPTNQPIRAGRDPQGTVGVTSGTRATEGQGRPRSENAKLIRELSRLGTFYNQEAVKTVEEAKQQEEAIEEKFEALEETVDLAHLLFGCDVAFHAAPNWRKYHLKGKKKITK